MLTKLRQVAEPARRARAAPWARPRERRVERRLEEIIDLLWQSDELRVAKPDVVDEARNAVYYLDELHRNAVPDTLETLVDELARLGVDLPVEARPLRFGSWIGGDRDGNPNVLPTTTLEVLALQHEHALRDALAVIDELRADLSSSVRITGVTAQLEASLAADLERLPELDQRYRRLNAEEPYRLKLTCVRQKLLNTRARLAGRRRHEPGRDYVGTTELLADLELVRDSLLLHRGELIARGRLEQAMRTLGRLRPAPGHARRPRARRRPPRGRRRSSSTASATPAGPTATSTATSAARCSPPSCRSRRPLAPTPPPLDAARARAPTTPSRPSAAPWTPTAPTPSSPTSSRCAAAPTTCSPPPCWPARRGLVDLDAGVRADRLRAAAGDARRAAPRRRDARGAARRARLPAAAVRCAATCRR